MTKKRKLKRLVVGAVALIGLTAGGWLAWSSFGAGAEPLPIETYTVRRGSLVEVASASGTIEPHVQVELKSRTSGEVTEVLVQEGEDVEESQVLVRLDPIDAERTIADARTALQRARADLTQAQANLAVGEAQVRQADMDAQTRARGAELGLISAEEQRTAATALETARANRELRQAQISASRAAVASAQLTLEEALESREQTEIRAPIAGTVLSVQVERGSIVASGITSPSGGTVLMVIADLNDLRVIGQIDESQVGRVSRGQPVTVRVDAYPEREFSGRVERVARLGQTVSTVVTFDVEVTVTDENAHLLRSGMSADVEIVTVENEDVLLLPLIAVQSTGRRQSVTMANGEVRRVRTGASDGARIAVTDGLEEGEVIQLTAVFPAADPASAVRGERPSGTKMLLGGGRRGGVGRSR